MTTTAADQALSEFAWLAGQRNEIQWARPEKVESCTGRPVELTDDDHGNWLRASIRVHDAALVDAIADGLDAGVAQSRFVGCRGWLSRDDVAALIARAEIPHPDSIKGGWVQHATLTRTRDTLAALTEEGRGMEAERLARSARTFLRQWTAVDIPLTPPERRVEQRASSRRSLYVEAWRQARRDLLREIRDLAEVTAARRSTPGSA